MNIKLFYDNVSFRIKGWRNLKKLIEKVIMEEKGIPGDLSFILTTDTSLIEINREFLNHNYFTDVICFDYSSESRVSGEIYISIDTVKINAKNYKVSYNLELERVMIHGILHLCGYDDKDTELRHEMKIREDLWLNKLESKK